jgi:hypothetical protein
MVFDRTAGRENLDFFDAFWFVMVSKIAMRELDDD